MTRDESLALLRGGKEGIAKWNLLAANRPPSPYAAGRDEWSCSEGPFHEEADLEGADLEGADLEGADLHEVNLRAANLRGANLKGARFLLTNLENAFLIKANLEGVDLRCCALENAHLAWANLKGVNLEKAHLKDSSFVGANLEGANFERANLEGANLRQAIFVAANLEYANMRRAEIHMANLTGANLKMTNLEGASLKDACLQQATLNQADLKNVSLKSADLKGARFTHMRCEGADLRNVSGLILDDVFIRGAQFSSAGFFPWMTDPWTQLRQSYTGPRMLFNLLLLLGFLVPLAAKVLFWFAVHQAESSLERASVPIRTEVANLHQELEQYPGCAPAIAASQRLEEFVNNPNLSKCLGKKCTERSVASVLFGFDGQGGWWLPAFAVVMLVYNLLRVVMTWLVAEMRDSEERSGWSPPYDRKFKALVMGHYLTWSLGMLAAGSFLIHAVTFLSSPIVVPW